METKLDLPKDFGIIFEESSLTQQQFAEEADINAIIERYRSTGYLSDPLNPSLRNPSFGDFSSESSYLEAQLIIARSQEMFDQLPSSLRERFSNDPSKLLAFVDDASNFDEAVKLGLLSAPDELQLTPARGWKLQDAAIFKIIRCAAART